MEIPKMIRPPTRFFRFALMLVLAGSLAACDDSPQSAASGPIEITRDTHCSLDGMTLADYPGPKAQIHYAQGNPDFFCDTVEMFSIYLQPEEAKRVTAIYVNDMGKNDWNQPGGHWIDAKTAFYVAGSKRLGSMGPTFASFAQEADARAFAEKEGGKVLRFDEVTPDMVTLDGGVLKDRHM
jgi:copper chaperone NosL